MLHRKVEDFRPFSYHIYLNPMSFLSQAEKNLWISWTDSINKIRKKNEEQFVLFFWWLLSNLLIWDIEIVMRSC